MRGYRDVSTGIRLTTQEGKRFSNPFLFLILYSFFFKENQTRMGAGVREQGFPRAQERFFDPATSRSAAKS